MSDQEMGLIDQVAALMVEAGQTIIMPLFDNLAPEDVATKSSDTDFVTIADREAEFWLIPRLEALLDDVFVVGEESISDTPALAKKIGKGLSFVIDPIDGTRNFVNGSRHFCSMISLIDQNQPLVAWVYRPLDQDILVAVHDEGVHHMKLDDSHNLTNWQEISRVFDRTSLSDMNGTGGIKGLSGGKREEVKAQLRALKGRKLIGSAGCEAALIALGEHDFLMHSKTTAWDHTPVDLIAREIGAVSYNLPTGEGYSPNCDDALLIAPDHASWRALANHIWPDPVTMPDGVS
ncbi:MAG: inositol monophosphatase family protein [Candidatus Puniceispirillaceae bacterium]